MKKQQYENRSYKTEFWFAKLAEEFGEVAREVVDIAKLKPRERNLIEELEHVEFIARCFREDLMQRESVRNASR
jgi:NTP pyrophosphatase (non-canonical NTP hydrolase)